MYRMEEMLSLLNDALDTQEKRHIAGGMLLSISLLFCGLAFTVITMNEKEKQNGK